MPVALMSAGVQDKMTKAGFFRSRLPQPSSSTTSLAERRERDLPSIPTSLGSHARGFPAYPAQRQASGGGPSVVAREEAREARERWNGSHPSRQGWEARETLSSPHASGSNSPAPGDTFGRSSRPQDEFGVQVHRQDTFGSPKDDRFTSVPSRRSRRRPSTPPRDEMEQLDAVSSPPPRIRRMTEEDSHESTASSGSGAPGSLGLNPLGSSTSTTATALSAPPTAPVSMTLGSDEMLFALLAGQAAVDCHAFEIGGWEEVEGWKKELSLLSNRLEALQARHQREVKILTAARTLQKLNSSHKRLSKQTMESLEQSERRVDAAEKEVLVLRDREAALRRRLMEHWSGVMAWEVRRLERQATDACARIEDDARREAELETKPRELEVGGGGGAELEAARRREEELEARLRQAEAERDEHSARARNLEIELDEHANESRKLTFDLEQHSSRAQTLERQLESHAGRSGDVEQQRDQDASRIRELEGERDRRGKRIAELEEIVVELGRRERALEESTRDLEDNAVRFREERAEWNRERDELLHEREQLVVAREGLLARSNSFERSKDTHTRELDKLSKAHAELSAAHAKTRDTHAADREAWNIERAALLSRHGALETERSQLSSAAQTVAMLCGDFGALLQRQMDADDLPAAVGEVKAMLSKRDRQIAGLREELSEVNSGFETEIRRLNDDRDMWMAKAAASAKEAQNAAQNTTQTSRATQAELTELARRIRQQNDEIKELKAGGASRGIVTGDVDDSKLAGAAAELASMHAALSRAWAILPPPGLRAEAGLSSPSVVSPNTYLDFSALQKAYRAPPSSSDKYTGVDGLVARVSAMVEDGRLLVERLHRTEIDKEVHKANALKAANLVQASQQNMEIYRRQIDDYEAALAAQDGDGDEELRAELIALKSEVRQLRADNRILSEVTHSHAPDPSDAEALREQLLDARTETRQLADDLAQRKAAIERLTEVNDQLSARTLAMADEAEKEKRAIGAKVRAEVEALRKELQAAQDGADDERARFSEQRVQMLDEMNSLQAEVQELRLKLRR